MRKLVVALMGAVVLVGAPLFLMEGIFRLLPVNTGLGTRPVDAAQPVMHFTPDRDYVYSIGWDFSLVNRGRVNNAGFVNDQDYDPTKSSPLLAVIGDSYVEALMVPYAQTLQGRLAASVGDKGRVYSFAASGAPLSQYLAWADFARRTYKPVGMVFVVVGNDFDESLLTYKNSPGFHYFARKEGGDLALSRVDYSPSLIGRLATSSALAKYVAFNLKAIATISQLAASPKEARYFGNTSAEADEVRLADSQAAVEAFFRDLPSASGLPPERIAFLIDGVRTADGLTAAVEQSYFMRMRAYFIAAAKKRRHEVVDLQPMFLAGAHAEGAGFDFSPVDGHWNGAGHAVAADALMASTVFHDLFGN